MPRSKPILCGSIAGKIGGMGAHMHRSAYKELGLDYNYVSFEVDDPGAAITAVRILGIRGLGVTMPFKERVIPFIDEIDPAAEKIGAVNTIVNNEGVLSGYNTDWTGAEKALLEKTILANKKIALLGAGGGGKSLLYAISRHTDRIFLFNRSEQSGRDLAAKYGVEYCGGLENLSASLGYDILINTTSVGFKSTESPLAAEQIISGCTVMDVIFDPVETGLIKAAKYKGCTVVTGDRMVLHQACGQFLLYTGINVPFEIMQKALEEYKAVLTNKN